MRRIQSMAIVILFVFSLVNLPDLAIASPGGLHDGEEHIDPMTMVVDMALARPLGLVSTVAGLVVFLVASPLSALGGNTDETWSILVVAPANYTFHRPIGHFEP
jgi:hypothetical protein